jgi:hypothetical protein
MLEKIIFLFKFKAEMDAKDIFQAIFKANYRSEKGHGGK